MISKRIEFEKPVRFAGEPVSLYVSSGPWDDYLELVLPDGVDGGLANWERLASSDRQSTDEGLDLRVHAGPPLTVSALALYTADPGQRSSPHRERLASLLARLVRLEPRLDLGDLLPERPPQPALSDESVRVSKEGEAAEMAGPTTPEAAASTRTDEATAVSSSPSPGPEPKPSRNGHAAPPNPLVLALAPGMLRKAWELVARGEVEKALRVIEVILRQNPGYRDAWELGENLSRLQQRAKRRRRAPRNPQAHLEAGFSYLYLGCHEKAIGALRQATQLDPGLYLGHLLPGVSLHHQGQARGARRAYERAQQLRPDEGIPRGLLAALANGELPPPVAEDRPGRRDEAPDARPMHAWAHTG